MTQYNNYAIQVCDDGCLIRDYDGRVVGSAPTEEEAREFIDDCSKDYRKPDYNYLWECYTKSMPGRCWIDGMVVTNNKKVLDRYIGSFERLHNVFLNVDYFYDDGEYFYYVSEIRS